MVIVNNADRRIPLRTVSVSESYFADEGLQWSPDGRRFVVCCGRDPDAWVVESNPLDTARFVSTPVRMAGAFHGAPVFDKTSQALYYFTSSDSLKSSEIWRQELKPSTPTLVHGGWPGEQVTSMILGSSSGDDLVVAALGALKGGRRGSTIRLVNLASGEARILLHSNDDFLSAVGWIDGPDPSVIFAEEHYPPGKDPTSDLIVISLATQKRKVVPLPGGVRWARLHPDHRRVAFVTDSADVNLVIVDPR